jgi:pyruvate,orthophosphate dikinase
MIELPRACVTSDQIAAVDFYSFGTNDLTQTVYGLSRDDAGRFLPFMENGILWKIPIAIDQTGVGADEGCCGDGQEALERPEAWHLR